jgi:protein gp37
MSDGTSIEWTDATWNPVRGCARVSPGCVNCYAERQAIRQSGPGRRFEGLVRSTANGPRWTGQMRTVPEKLDQPLRWREPRRIFVNSMSDLFHDDVPNEFIAAVFGVMAAAPQHTFQVLTKRAERMRDWFRWLDERGGIYRYIRSIRVDGDRTIPDLFNAVVRTETLRGRTVRSMSDPWMQVFNAAAVSSAGPLFNVWLGVSAEDQQRADERIPLLFQTPAAVRFVSAEPLLGPIDLRLWLGMDCQSCGGGIPRKIGELSSIDVVLECGCRYCIVCSGRGRHEDHDERCAGPTRLAWTIIGGESGPGARACDAEWVRDIVEQCRSAGVAAFVKQLGAEAFDSSRTASGADEVLALRSKKGGDMQEWPPDLRVREFPGPRA